MAEHESNPDADAPSHGSPEVNQHAVPGHGAAAEADLAAAVSLSGLSVDPWAHQQPLANPSVQLQHEENAFMQSRPYGQDILSPHLFDGGK